MRIDLSLRDDRGLEQDVSIVAPAGSTLGDLGGALHQRLHASDPQAPLWSGARELTTGTPLGGAGLVDGAVLSLAPPQRHDAAHPALLALHVVGGPDAGRVVPLRPGELSVGRDTSCELVLADPDVSRHHLTIHVAPGRVSVCDQGSTNGTLLDGARLDQTPRPLVPGALVQLGRSALNLTEATQAPAALHTGPDGGRSVNRGPRAGMQVPDTDVVLPRRPQHGRAQRVQWVAALVPAAAGVTLAVVLHMPQFLLFGLLSPLLLLGTALGDRVHWRRQRRRDAATYRARLARARHEVAAKLYQEQQARRWAAPDPAAVALIATTPSARLWERRRTDPDLLCIRLGLTSCPSTLHARCGNDREPAGVVHAVPAGADLRQGPLGIAAPPGIAAGIARWSVCQLAALVSPADLQLALLAAPAVAERWRWARWLPHLDAERVATNGESARRVISELNAEIQRRRSGTRPVEGTGWPGPWLVALIDRAGDGAELPGLLSVLTHGSAVGITAICIDERAAGLPSGCRSIARASDETGSTLSVSGSARILVADRVSSRWAERIARALAPLRDAASTTSGTLPAQCRLLDVLGTQAAQASALARRWRAAGARPCTVLGLGHDGPVSIDLARDGPHVLIAGTTGSGKSELLRSLVAGLAAAQPPDRLRFVLIDYKGGAAFAECARLPHTAGLVTDLDAQLTTRALQSLDYELKRRERVLARAGAADLEHYQARCAADSGGEPIGRLVLVVDEFAALAEELPQFITGLVSIAQRGRSLGVHLVLATQRPGGVVSAEIRANAGLRIALRVTDPGESADVIDSPAAASIHPGTPGRAFVRVGTTLIEMQTAHAGGRAERGQAALTVQPLDGWRRSGAPPIRDDEGPTELGQLVERLRAAAALCGSPGAAQPWLAPLPERLPLAALEQAQDGNVALGLVDLPAQQRQCPLVVDLATASSLLFAGGPRCGRSSALVTLALAAASTRAPSALHVYGIDCAGGGLQPLSALAHCATLAVGEDMDTVSALLRRLEQALAQRVARLAALGVSSAAEARADGHDLPVLICLLDGWDTFAALSTDYDGGRSAELLVSLLRAAPAAGLTVALTGDRGALTPRLAAAVHTKLLLRLTDRADYALAGVPAVAVPGSMPAGRAIRGADAAEVQLAFPGTPAEQARTASSLSARWPGADAPSDQSPIRIRPLPATVGLSELPADALRFTLGVGGDAATAIHIDPFAGAARLLVAGPARSGRSTVLALILRQGRQRRDRLVVAAPARSPLAALARRHALRLLGPDSPPSDLDEPTGRTLLLVDDSEAFLDTALGEALCGWVRDRAGGLAVVAAGRSDELSVTYRGLGAEVRRERCGLLLRPEPMDGDLLGVRLPRRRGAQPPGRGLLVADPAWSLVAGDDPIPVQIALP